MSRSAEQGISTALCWGLLSQEEARDEWSLATIGDGRRPSIKNLLEWKSLLNRTISIGELTGAKYGHRAEPFVTHLVHKGAALMVDGDLKYPWQQFLLEAFMEFDPDRCQ